MSVTVLILTHDAGPGFAETLEALGSQRPQPAELIVVDTASSDGTAELAAAAGARVHRVAVADFDFGRTRDLGYALARTELVANLSQDVVPKDASWLRLLTDCFADPAVGYASARCEARDPERMFLWQRLGRFYFTREMSRFRARYGVPISNASSCVRRRAWEQVRHGAMPIAEDMWLQTRLMAAGWKMAYVEAATAWHQHQFSARGAFKRAWNEGHAARRMEIPYAAVDAALDAFAPSIWLTLARQATYGRVRRPADLLYPLLRPLALWGGHRFGRRYWR